MAKEKMELSLQDESGQECVAYPFVESTDVSLSNGMDIETMIAQDVSLPTIVHSETSFKAGVGDSDVSNSIVDSSVASMTIKGQTYQNILPEPSLRNAMTDGKTVQKINEGYETVEVADGVSKSAILKGQTLVNSFITSYYQHGGMWGIIFFKSELMVKGKKYIIVLQNLPENCQWAVTNYDGSVMLLNYTDQLRGVFTSSLNGFEDTFALHINDGETIRSLEELQKVKPMLIEYQDGMENWDIPYFEGMQSVEAPTVTTVGKNLYYSTHSVSSGFNGMSVVAKNGESFINGTCTKNDTDYYFASPDQNAHVYKLISNLPRNGARLTLSNTLNKANYFRIGKRDGTVSYSRSVVMDNTVKDLQCFVRFMQGDTYQDVNIGIMIEYTVDTNATTYESHKSNTLSTSNEVVLRSLPNGVCDTLDLMTGEYVQRIGEVVLDGSETWYESANVAPNHYCAFARVQGSKNALSYNIVCNSLPVRNILSTTIDYEGCMFNEWSSGDKANVVVKIANSKLSSTSVEGIKAYLQSNPLTVQYELATPIIKTVDLSSSGNWEKVVLDGVSRVDWVYEPQFNRYYLPFSNLLKAHTYTGLIFCDNEKYTITPSHLTVQDYDYAISGYRETHTQYNDNWLYIAIKECTSKQMLLDYLSQNPITVWYQTTTNQDSTNVKEMLSFSNGHVQLSSAEGSLIPSLTYEAPTSNSYQLDLAKPSTKYTMKSSSASGNFTIDGTQYNFSTNGTFTTPSTMDSKLMIANGTVKDLMFIEGDVTSKTIPYFKGIKSAFEDEDKIEVLSTGKNLIDETLWTKSIIEDGIECLYGDGWYSSSGNVGTPILIPVDIKQGKRYRISVTHKATTHFNNYKILQDCLNNRVVGNAQSVCILDRLNTFTESNASFVANFDAKYLIVDTGNPRCYGYIKKGTLIIEEIERDGVITAYEPYKSNSTKIPLLSPLRSLPNGVCDEIVLDRENNKAKIIQRVGELIHYGQGGTVTVETKGEYHKYGFYGLIKPKQNSYSYNSVLMCDTFMWNDNMAESQGEKISTYKHSTGTELRYAVSPHKASLLTESYFRDWLSQNPVTVYYELETPVITEVDLEGFPYIYKDGHIFLNGEIAPVTEIKYSINQQHQIESSSQDLIRHQKEIDYLYKLIGEYVRVDYKNTLLSLNLELK